MNVEKRGPDRNAVETFYLVRKNSALKTCVNRFDLDGSAVYGRICIAVSILKSGILFKFPRRIVAAGFTLEAERGIKKRKAVGERANRA